MSESIVSEFNFPPRRETFLARYPRNVKLGATAALLALLILPPAWIHGQLHNRVEGPATEQKNAVDTNTTPYMTGKVESDVAAAALNDPEDRSIRLVPAPDPRVTEDTAEGPMPRISPDGLRPWQVYARPFNNADKRPRIALVITGLGMSRVVTDQAIAQLPPAVTLGFNSQAAVVGAWMTRARQDGHETLLQVPMEPFDYPRSDPGPETLLTNLPTDENLARLMRVMRHASGYVGVTTTFGSSFTADSGKFAPILRVLHNRGLMVLDARVSPHSIVTDMARATGVPVATVSHRLDGDLAPESITLALNNLERSARQNGRAIGITSATPLMVNQLQAWMKTLPERGIAVAPLTAMVE